MEGVTKILMRRCPTGSTEEWWGTYVNPQGQLRYIHLTGEFIVCDNVYVDMEGWSGVPESTGPVSMLPMSQKPPSDPPRLSDKRFEKIRLCGNLPHQGRLELMGDGSDSRDLQFQYTAIYSMSHDVVRLQRTLQGSSPPVPDAVLAPYFSPKATRIAFTELPLPFQTLLKQQKCKPDCVVQLYNPVSARNLLLARAEVHGIKPVVRTAFHGTAPRAARSIVEHGFSHNNPINGQAFGAGVYFTLDPKYAAKTIYRRFGPDGTRVMLVCQILEGTNTKSSSSTTLLTHATTGGDGKNIRLVFWPNVLRDIIITHMLFYGAYDACAYARMCLDAGLYLGKKQGTSRIVDITSDEIMLSNGQATTLHDMWLQQYTWANLDRHIRRLPGVQHIFVPGMFVTSTKQFGRKLLLIKELLNDGDVIIYIHSTRTSTRLTRQEFIDAEPVPHFKGYAPAWWLKHLRPGYVVLYQGRIATVMVMSGKRVFLTYRLFHPDGKKQESPTLLPFDGLAKRADEWVDKDQCRAPGTALNWFMRQMASQSTPPNKKRSRGAKAKHPRAPKKLKL